MHKAYAATQDSGSNRMAGPLTQGLADAVCDSFHLELRAGDLLQELVRGRALALGPELLQKRARFARGEPVRPETRPQVVAELRLECPGAQVRVNVEALVDVGQVVRGARLDLERVAEQLDVALRHSLERAVAVELELVEQLGRVAAHEEEQPHLPLRRVLVRPRAANAARQRGGPVGPGLPQ